MKTRRDCQFRNHESRISEYICVFKQLQKLEIVGNVQNAW